MTGYPPGPCWALAAMCFAIRHRISANPYFNGEVLRYSPDSRFPYGSVQKALSRISANKSRQNFLECVPSEG